jgi:hypothetical protein
MTAAAGGGGAPFALPARTDDRETAEGWTRWRTTRHDFVSAPVLTLADYRLLSPRHKTLHDLHRAATHSNLHFQETPMSLEVARLVGRRIQNNALKREPVTRAGVMVSGGGYQGKTETVCEVAAAFEELWLDAVQFTNPEADPGTRDDHFPVVYVQTPVKATPKSLCKTILDFFGGPIAGRWTLPDLVRQVRTCLRDHAVKALIIDDITRLKMHREDDQDTLDLIRGLMSMGTTLVLVGVDIRGSGLLGRVRPDTRVGLAGAALAQTRRRFDVINLDPFSYDTPTAIGAWTSHLAGIEQQIRLFHTTPGMLTDGTMPEYLFRRTDGVVGYLERLIEDGCSIAIEDGLERLDEALLDGVAINLEGSPGRDPGSGEIPPVPTAAGPGATAKSGRNTVFDDHSAKAAG